jgi:hypothetical protein
MLANDLLWSEVHISICKWRLELVSISDISMTFVLYWLPVRKVTSVILFKTVNEVMIILFGRPMHCFVMHLQIGIYLTVLLRSFRCPQMSVKKARSCTQFVSCKSFSTKENWSLCVVTEPVAEHCFCWASELQNGTQCHHIHLRFRQERVELCASYQPSCLRNLTTLTNSIICFNPRAPPVRFYWLITQWLCVNSFRRHNSCKCSQGTDTIPVLEPVIKGLPTVIMPIG